MPLIKSAIKRNKQAQVRRQRNLVVKTAVRADIKVVQAAIAGGDAKQAAEAYRAAVSEIDRAVKKGTYHANTAARKKSRLNAAIKRGLGEAAKPTKATATKAKTAAKKPVAKKAAASTAKKSTAKKATPKK